MFWAEPADMRSMAGDLLDQIRRDIRERKQELQGAHEEAQLLERALEALGASARRGAGQRRSQARRPARRGTPQPAASRARRGANRGAILVAVDERPGATTREIADFTGIARNTVASTLTRLAADGLLERSELPAGGVGFRPARTAAAD
jgi:CRP-like cAMP-binding protein